MSISEMSKLYTYEKVFEKKNISYKPCSSRHVFMCFLHVGTFIGQNMQFLSVEWFLPYRLFNGTVVMGCTFQLVLTNVRYEQRIWMAAISNSPLILAHLSAWT